MSEPDIRQFIEESGDPRQMKKSVLGKLNDLLERNGIDADDIGKVHRINMWQGMSKNDEGDPEVTDLIGIQLSPVWEDGPQWPVVTQAKPCTVKFSRKARSVSDNYKVTAILPDPQFGYLRLDDGEMISMHDDQAIACTLELLATIRPQRIIWLGDTVDFAEWSSKFLVLPEFSLTTQETIDSAHYYLADSLSAAGPQVEDAYLMEGNHDNRMANAIARNAMAALRLRKANAPDTWPVLSLPNLLRLDELGITYVDGYPAGRIKIAEAYPGQAPLFALHGERLDVVKQAKAERVSTVQGHAHHVALHSTTYYSDGERLDVEAWSLGCLCKTDGAVPSTKGGHDVRGRPVERQESWQHAMGVLTETSNGWWMEPVRIRDGKAIWQGKEYSA
jgi:hypothetical protein